MTSWNKHDVKWYDITVQYHTWQDKHHYNKLTLHHVLEHSIKLRAMSLIFTVQQITLKLLVTVKLYSTHLKEQLLSNPVLNHPHHKVSFGGENLQLRRGHQVLMDNRLSCKVHRLVQLRFLNGDSSWISIEWRQTMCWLVLWNSFYFLLGIEEVKMYCIVVGNIGKLLANHQSFLPQIYRIFKCDQICQHGSYTCTVSSLTFHRHSTDTTID